MSATLVNTQLMNNLSTSHLKGNTQHTHPTLTQKLDCGYMIDVSKMMYVQNIINVNYVSGTFLPSPSCFTLPRN